MREQNHIHRSLAGRLLGASAGAALALSLAVPSGLAIAEGYTTAGIGSFAQVQIEALTETYEDAHAKAQEANERAAENQSKIDVLTVKLDAQQVRSDQAMRLVYMMQRNKWNELDAMLGAQTFDEFVKQVDYYERVNATNLSELNKLKDTMDELEQARIELKSAKSEADAQEALAQAALETLQKERVSRQSAAAGGTEGSPDGADWYMSKEDFVAEWGPRIDAYLAGSPMTGLGDIFAEASWRYCVDPRWSPAISCIESGKGVACARAHNAWGWGASDPDPVGNAVEWPSWEVAIDAHVKGLANGYGYTISRGAAKTYCPPNAELWYEKVRSEMSSI